MLKCNVWIERLDLHWNFIGGQSAVKFFNELKENEGVKELDLSFNSLGGNGDSAVARSLAEFFIENKSLSTWTYHTTS